MAVVLGRQEVNVRVVGSVASIPSSPTGKLMYYLRCVTSVLQMDDEANIRRFTDYTKYYTLTDMEIDNLLILCIMLSPDELINKCFFQDDDLCGDSNNEFFELSAVQTHMLVTEAILIGGQSRRVNKIMAFKAVWLKNNYIGPMKSFSGRIHRIHRTLRGEPEPRAITAPKPPPRTYSPPSRTSSDSCFCTIL